MSTRRPTEPDLDPDPEPDRGTPEWPRGPRRRERDPDDNGPPDDEPDEDEEPEEPDAEDDAEDETLDQAAAVTTSSQDWGRPPVSRTLLSISVRPPAVWSG